VVEPPTGNTPGTLEPDSVSTKQRRIAELAKQHPERVFVSEVASNLVEIE
jgi:hypothetical protein